MIKEKTILVVGAGASKPYGLPLGTELRDLILSYRGKVWLEPLFEMGYSYTSYDEFASDLAGSGYFSIDSYLENRKKFLKLGKAAIVLTFAPLLRWWSVLPPNGSRDDWLPALWHKLYEKKWNNFRKNRLTIVTFNYDTGIEDYLSKLIKNHYKVSDNAIARWLSANLIYVHGHLRPTVRRRDRNRTIIAPGLREVDAQEIREQSKLIEVIFEKNSRSGKVRKIQKIAEDAERILFVGFGYHHGNMKKLGLTSKRKNSTKKLMVGTHKRIKTKPWAKIVEKYGFSNEAKRTGAGKISEFIEEWL